MLIKRWFDSLKKLKVFYRKNKESEKRKLFVQYLKIKNYFVYNFLLIYTSEIYYFAKKNILPYTQVTIINNNVTITIIISHHIIMIAGKRNILISCLNFYFGLKHL